MTGQQYIIEMNITKTVSHQHMIKDFTPHWLCLLCLASNGLTLSIMLKYENTSVYNAQIAQKPIPMALECPKTPM